MRSRSDNGDVLLNPNSRGPHQTLRPPATQMRCSGAEATAVLPAGRSL